MDKIISSYLDYLRDVSRKIISRNGFEQVLLDKSKKNPSFAYQINEYSTSIPITNLAYQHFIEITKHLERNSDKQLFIGFGFICGQRNGRTYAGPILFAECDISQNGNVAIDIDYSSISINYDLLSSLLGSNNSAEDEEYNASYESEISLIEEIEVELNDIFAEEDQVIKKIQRYSEEHQIHYLHGTTLQIKYKFSFQFAKYILLKFVKDIKQFSDIPIGYNFNYQSEVTKNKEGNSIFNEKVKYYDSIFYFVNVVPDQLSTFIALNKLSNEIKSKNFKNPTLEKLLLNSLTDNKRALFQKDCPEIVKILNNLIPLNLSLTQKKAIKNVFECELSYIQGPPGTGKSYTISAIILCALFLNKKVLLISQKKPALEVVKEKTEPFFSNTEDKVKGIIYFDREARRSIREQIKELLNVGIDTWNLKKTIDRLRENISEKQTELNWYLTKIEVTKKNLEDTLQLEYEYKNINETFFDYLKNVFNKNYHNLEIGHRFTNISNFEKIDLIIAKLSKLYSLPYKNMAIKLFETKIINLMVDNFNLNMEYLYNSFPSYAISMLELNKYYTQTVRKKSEIKYSSKILRNEIEHYQTVVEKLQKEIFRQIFLLNLYSQILKDEYQKELGKFNAMLRYTKIAEIQSRMNEIDFELITDIMPFWAAEIRHLGQLFPMKPDLFDLIIVDEASQVNLAEVLPAFYRGKNICIVGDHKQLNVKSTGIGFQLSRKFDDLTWHKHNRDYLTYAYAKTKYLTVSDASILDFIMSEYNNILPPSVMLDEHFRSLPQLANYTNTFYKESGIGGFKIMTETCDKVHTKSFYWQKVIGIRNDSKEIKEEALAVIKIIKKITNQNQRIDIIDDFKFPYQLDQGSFSIGVISMIRNQCNLIQSMIEDNIDSRILEKHKVMIGTPEEFQGNERDIMIFSLGLDENCKHSVGFFQDAKRLNVATSRARFVTIFVYSAIPKNFNKIISYLRYFKGELNKGDIDESEDDNISQNYAKWSLDINAYDSEFERHVFIYLDRYTKQKNASIKIFNQVQSCGQKRLDFVVFNEENKKSVAVEVDGCHHFLDNQYGRIYSQDHIERNEILKRAGWKIINTPYYKWYNDGWLCDERNEIFNKEIERIYMELDKNLF